MNKEDTEQRYYAAIGEFVVSHAILEMHLTKLISTKKAKARVNGFRLVVSVAPNFNMVKKMHKINNYITDHLPDADNAFKNKWKEIHGELLIVYEARNYLVHGCIVGLIYLDPIDSFLTDEEKNEMTNKKFYLEDILKLTTNIKAITKELNGNFWHTYAKLCGYSGHAITGIELGAIDLRRPVTK